MNRASSIFVRLRSIITPSESNGSPDSDKDVSSGAVVICLLVSGLLWFAFSMQETYPLVLNLPTKVVNLEDDRVLSVLPPETVRVQVIGAGVSLFQVYYNRPTIEIDASLDEVDILSAELNLPKDVRIESVSPRVFNPVLENKSSKTIPIEFRSDISLPESFEFVEYPSITPDSVEIVGGESVIEAIESWPTVLFSRKDVRDSLSVELALVDTLIGIVETSLSHVSLQALSREFTGGEVSVDVTVRGVPSDKKLVTLDPSSITIRYRVLLDQFNEAKRSNMFTATVDYNDIRSDTTGSVRPYLTLPVGLEIRDVDYFPETLRYYNLLSSE